MNPDSSIAFDVFGREVRLSHPGKVMFPEQGWTKLDVARHYLACAEGALRGVYARPVILKRWPAGAGGQPFYQKRAPKTGSGQARDGADVPDRADEPGHGGGFAGLGSSEAALGRGPGAAGEHEYAEVRFPSGRTADFLVPRHPADIIWMVQLDCLDLNPWPVRAGDLQHPDELRVDLDPSPGVGFATVREVALVCGEVLTEHGLRGWPKTSGSRGIHILVRIEPRWTFGEVRGAALALAREVERLAPDKATSAWWKEERHGVFIDYNQNAGDRSVASAYSVRQTGLVSAPLSWDEVASADPLAFRLDTFATGRYARSGDLTRGIDEAAGRLDGLLELAQRQERAGLADAPWPPHFDKQEGEPPRVRPSRKRGTRVRDTGGSEATDVGGDADEGPDE